jgi:hypothetical protein
MAVSTGVNIQTASSLQPPLSIKEIGKEQTRKQKKREPAETI